jgi:hypothetical protein
MAASVTLSQITKYALRGSLAMTTRRGERSKLKRGKRQTASNGQRSAAELRKQLNQRTSELSETQNLLAEALQQQSFGLCRYMARSGRVDQTQRSSTCRLSCRASLPRT